MMVINVLLALAVATAFFLLGKNFSDNYHEQAEIKLKEELERQYLRLSVNMDADDPCKPYIAPRYRRTGNSSARNELLSELVKKVNKDGQGTVLINKP